MEGNGLQWGEWEKYAFVGRLILLHFKTSYYLIIGLIWLINTLELLLILCSVN